jgi:hypothetical protein
VHTATSSRIARAMMRVGIDTITDLGAACRAARTLCRREVPTQGNRVPPWPDVTGVTEGVAAQ